MIPLLDFSKPSNGRQAERSQAKVKPLAPPQEPTDRQKLFLELPHKEAFYGGAAGGGKSSALLMAAMQYIDVPSYSALILRRTFQDLAKPGALMDRSREWLTGTGATWNEQKKQWRFPSGAVIAFGYLENENDKYQYQGAEFQGIFFDELTQFTESQYRYLFSRLRRLADVDIPIRMRSASNPGGVGGQWVQDRFIPEDWHPGLGIKLQLFEKDGRAFVPARIKDNPHLDQAAYEESLMELDEVTRTQLLEGDWQVRERGNIYTTWSDGHNGHHVITWSQFAEKFGRHSIPDHWLGAVGQDWGFDPDPCATVWNFVAGANSGLAGSIFVPAIYTAHKQIPDDVGEEMKRIETEWGWSSRIQYRVMSHEASSQLETYRVKHNLNFQKWKPDRHGGIAQMQHYLRIIDSDRPHPFKPWLMGRPSYFVVVPDDQMVNPKGDVGLALLREEFAVYKYQDQRVTQIKGAAPIAPYDFFNHYMDAQRGIAAKWFAPIKPLTPDERIEEAVPDGWKLENAPKTDGFEREGWEMAREWQVGKVRKRLESQNQGFDDTFEPKSPLSGVWGGDPWGNG